MEHQIENEEEHKNTCTYIVRQIEINREKWARLAKKKSILNSAIYTFTFTRV